MSALYLENITAADAVVQLCKIPNSLLAEQIVACFNRGIAARCSVGRKANLTMEAMKAGTF